MNTQRPATKVTRPTGSGKHPEPDLTAPDVLRQALAALEKHVHLPRPPEADYSSAEIFSVLLYAAAHRTTIEQHGEDLVDGVALLAAGLANWSLSLSTASA